MQVAINALIFVLGFSVAVVASTRPKQARAELERVISNVNYILDSLRHPSKAKFFAAVQIAPQNEDDGQALYSRAEAEETFGPETWQRKALETVIALIEPKQHPQKKTFPCIFATKGQRNNEHRYIFLHSDDPSEPRNVRIMARALRQYLPNSRSLGPNTSVLTICPPTPEGAAKRSFEYYNRVFWDTLRGLRISDPVPWIKDIPQATSSSKWAFCYAGEAVFPVALTPLYEKRHSRWAPSFVVALQPKWVFDDLLDTPERRKNATSKVRALLKKYDDVDVSPDLTAYGDEGTSEVHQLFLRDDNDETMQCPFTNIEESHGSELDSSSGSDVASNGSGSRSNSF